MLAVPLSAVWCVVLAVDAAEAGGAGAGVAARCVAAQPIVTQQTVDGAFINICGQRDRISELQHQCVPSCSAPEA